MRPVLLLVPDRDGVPARLRRQVELCSAGAVEPDADHATDYATVIVLNDGRAGTVQRLRQALALRERCHELQIGVLTWLDAQSAEAELGPGLKIELKEMLSVEYQA